MQKIQVKDFPSSHQETTMTNLCKSYVVRGSIHQKQKHTNMGLLTHTHQVRLHVSVSK